MHVLGPKGPQSGHHMGPLQMETVEETTYEPAGSTHVTKLNGTSSPLCIVLDYESSLLATFNGYDRTRTGHILTLLRSV